MLRLADTPPSARTAVGAWAADLRKKDRPGLRAALQRLAPQLLDRATALLPQELARATGYASQGIIGLTESAYLLYARVLERLGPRPEHLMPLLEGCRQIPKQWVDPSAVFSLATMLNDISDKVGGEQLTAARELAADLVDAGVRCMSSAEELSMFERLEHLRDPYESRLGEMVTRVLEYEVEGLCQQDDLSVVNGWYSDIMDLAERHRSRSTRKLSATTFCSWRRRARSSPKLPSHSRQPHPLTRPSPGTRTRTSRRCSGCCANDVCSRFSNECAYAELDLQHRRPPDSRGWDRRLACK